MSTQRFSKAFDLSFAETIRYELKDTGVTVTSLMPGPSDIDFFERADMLDTPAGQGGKDDPAKVAARCATARGPARDPGNIISDQISTTPRR